MGSFVSINMPPALTVLEKPRKVSELYPTWVTNGFP